MLTGQQKHFCPVRANWICVLKKKSMIHFKITFKLDANVWNCWVKKECKRIQVLERGVVVALGVKTIISCCTVKSKSTKRAEPPESVALYQGFHFSLFKVERSTLAQHSAWDTHGWQEEIKHQYLFKIRKIRQGPFEWWTHTFKVWLSEKAAPLPGLSWSAFCAPHLMLMLNQHLLTRSSSSRYTVAPLTSSQTRWSR